MDLYRDVHPEQFKRMTTAEMRQKFLLGQLFKQGQITLAYVAADRMIAGSAVPLEKPLALEGGKELGTNYFLERRELGIVNIGGQGSVTADGAVYPLAGREGLYLGKETKDVAFASGDPKNPALFYINSAPAHAKHPVAHITLDKANQVHLGSKEQCNQRTIYQYVHPAVCASCQLVMGLTVLQPGSIWNTMPCHTHERRMEVYLYLDIPEDAAVFHLMGEPTELRTLVVRDKQAVFSPSWSIHSGAGMRHYSFIWGMAGENQTFDDMDVVSAAQLQ